MGIYASRGGVGGEARKPTCGRARTDSFVPSNASHSLSGMYMYAYLAVTRGIIISLAWPHGSHVLVYTLGGWVILPTYLPTSTATSTYLCCTVRLTGEKR